MMRWLHRAKNKKQGGFTLVEMLVIAPIVILTIGAFITVIVNMTGDVLAARTSTLLAYNVQSALNRINADVNLSSTFLAQTKLTEGTTPPTTSLFSAPQGYNDDNDTTSFNNVDTTNGNMLILNTLATTANPLNTSAAYVYLTNLPNSCTSNQVSQNTPMTYNIVYFVKNNSLWRRVIMPSNYTSVGCNTPWQQPSCNPTYMTNHPGLTMCQTQDQDLLDNITTSGFNVQYFNTASSVTPNSVASDTTCTPTYSTPCVVSRNGALQSLATVGVSITVSTTAAGRSITQSGTIRATRLGTSASTIATLTPATTPGTPVVTGTFVAAPPTATVSWPSVSGGGAITYTVDYSLNGGSSWTNGSTGLTQTSYTYNATSQNQTVSFRVLATNSAGTSSYGTTSVTIPLWANMVLQNGWANYTQGFSTAAYTKTSAGLVVLKGLVAGGTATADTNIAILPVGYRPANTLMFAVSTNSTTGRLDIRPDGTVRFEVGSNAWFNLDGINFMPSGTTFTPLTPINSWVNYSNSTYSNPIGYTQASDGRVSLEGLVANGVTTAGTSIAALPASIAPSGYEHIAVLAGNAFGIMSLASAASPVPNAVIANSLSTNAFDSTQSLFYPNTYAGATALTLQNSWVWYGTIYSTPRYTKSADGMVVVNGLIKSGTATAGTVVATLPVGYRPSAEEIFLNPSNGAWGRMDVLPNGNIITDGISNAWVSLDTIAFMSEQ